jgi:hypothetical protein
VKWISIPGALGLAAVVSLIPVSADAATSIRWNMDERSGSTMHDRTGTYNGTIQGEVSLGVRGRHSHSHSHSHGGHRDRAYEFDGNGVVTVPSASVLNPGKGSFTVSVYYRSSTKPSAVGADSFDLVRKGFSTTRGGDWKVEVKPNGRASCLFRGARTVDVVGRSNVVNGSWNKITCDKSSAGVRLRVNDTTEAVADTDPGTVSNSAPMTVGAKSSSVDGTVGRLDSLTVRKG